MKFEVLGQQAVGGVLGVDLTGVDTDWTGAGLVDTRGVTVIGYGARSVAEKLVCINDQQFLDAWTVKSVGSAGTWYRGNMSRVVELANVQEPDFVTRARFSDDLVGRALPGATVTGVAYRLHEERGLFRNRRIIDFEAIESHEDDAEPVMVPVLRLHCPKHGDCVAREEYAVRGGESVQAKVTLMPVGGGIGTDTRVESESAWETTDGTCLQYLVPARIVTETGRLLLNGREIRTPAPLSWRRIEFVEGPHCQEEIPREQDGCGQSPTTIADDRRLTEEISVSAGNRDHTFSAVMKTSGTLTLGGGVSRGALGASFKYQREAEISFKRIVRRTPGATYLAYTAEPPANRKQPEHWEILWTTY